MPDNGKELQVALSAQTSQLEAGMAKAAEAVQTSSSRIASSLESMGARSHEAFTKAREGAISLPPAIEKVNEAVHGLEATFKAFGELAIVGIIFEIVNKLRELASETIESGVALEHMSQRTGVSVESLAALQKVGGLAGVSMEGFERSMRMVSLKLLEAKEGSASAAQAFARLHLGVSDLQGLNPEQAFLRIADATAKMRDGMDKAGAVAGLLGARMGTQLIPLLNQGSAGIKRLEGDFELLGTATKDQAEASERAHVALATMKAALESAGRSAVVSLVPAIEALAKGVEIATFGIEAFVEIIADAVKWLGEKLAPAIQFVEKVLHPFVAAVKVADETIKDWIGTSIRAAGGGGALDDLAKRYDEFKKKVQAANDIGVFSAALGGSQGEEGAGGNVSKKILKDRFTAYTDELRLEEEEKNKDIAFKVQAEQKIYDEAVRLFGATSLEARKQALEVQKAKNEQIAENQRLGLQDLANESAIAEAKVKAATDGIQRTAKLKEEQLKSQATLKGLSPSETKDQAIEIENIETQALKEAENQRYEIKRDGLEKQLAILRQHADQNKEAIAKLNTELEKDEIDHQDNLQKIDADSAKKLIEINTKAAKDSQKAWQEGITPIFDEFDKAFDTLLERGRNKWKKFTQDLAKSTLEGGIKQLLTGQGGGPLSGILKQILPQGGLAGAIGQSAQSGALQNAIQGLTSGMRSLMASMQSLIAPLGQVAGGLLQHAGTILASIVEWVANTAATTANTVVTAAASIGSALGFSGGGIVPSAAGGMTVGSGATPAILHPREMVLPRHLSEGVQNMINNGQTNGSAVHLGGVHIHALDAKSFRERLDEHGDAIMDVMASRMRTYGYQRRI